MTGSEFLAAIAWKSSVLLAAAFAAAWLLQRRPAAQRHFLWTAALCALLVLPLLNSIEPHWGWRTVTTRTAVATRHGGVRVTLGPAAPAPVSPKWLLWIWATGFAIAAVRFRIASWRTASMVRRAHPAAEPSPFPGIAVLESAEAPMALAWGIRRPTIVLPLEARAWPAERRRTVLLHEWMHVQRRDLPAQAAGQVACCFYWFHPLAWLAARQLRKERERACDDAVLRSGITAHDYAAHLLDLVRAMATRQTEWAGAAGMAGRSDVEARIRALLDRSRSRQPLSCWAAFSLSAAALAVLILVAGVSTFAQSARGSLHGVVKDPSGAVIPGCAVTARNLDGSNQEVSHCTPAGEYRFASIPPGQYEVQVTNVPGFAILKQTVEVTPATDTRMDAMMRIGSASETLTVSASGVKASVPSAVPAGGPQRIRVGGNVQGARLVSQQTPVYPDEAKLQGVEGTVLLQAIISKSGSVLNARVVNTDVDPRLAQAALDSVKQWRYLPTLLNGEPVEMVNTITVSFNLDQ